MEDHKLRYCECIQCTCGEVVCWHNSQHLVWYLPVLYIMLQLQLNRNGDEDDAKSVAAHFKNPASIVSHVLDLFTFGTQLVDSVSDLGKRLTKVEERKSSAGTEKTSQDLSRLQTSADKRFVEVVKQLEQLEQRQSCQSRTSDKNLIEEIKELQSRVQLLEEKGSRQVVEIRTLQTQLKHQHITKHSRGNSSRLSSLERRYEDIERQVTRLKVHVSEMELQLQASIASTYNGSFTWRIPDIMKRKREAINGQVTSLYSPPFYTAKNGYKMCIRIYLNGDGMGHETHMSLFFVLMKGEFDSLLKWPFDHKVSLILVDQKQRRHIVQTFKPTPESSSFQRPVSDMNVASGCPQFCKLSCLDDESYTKDDALFIKCIVDTSQIFHP